MMAVRRIMVATLSLLLLDIGAAEAKRHHRHRPFAYQATASHFAYEPTAPQPTVPHFGYEATASQFATSQIGQTQARVSRLSYRDRGRPHRAWCGWYLRHRFGISDPRLNLARNWARYYGRPHAGPCVGCVAVWRHHVGVITGFDGHNWIVHSGNDGGVVRTRPRSVAGAVFRTS
jgi:hypothetical protein